MLTCLIDRCRRAGQQQQNRSQKSVLLSICAMATHLTIDLNLQQDIHVALNVVADMNMLLNFVPPVCQRVNEAFASESWKGRDVFAHFSRHQYEFFRVVGETVTSFMEMLSLIVADINRLPTKLDEKNKLLMCLLWLKSYSTYPELALIFDVSQTDVSRVVNEIWPVLHRVFGRSLPWPTAQEWLSKRFNWPSLPGVVGCIDGTSHEILTPEDDNRTYYSGHRRYQCIHTQVIIDNNQNIRYVHSGIEGHENDAQSYRKMPKMGPDGSALYIPEDCWILADGIYPCEAPIITTLRKNQMALDDPEENARRIAFNDEARAHRVYVEHVIGKLKTFRVIGTVYRHQRDCFRQIVEICASLSQRRVHIFDDL